MAHAPSIKTVIFDIGGVVVQSPLLGINKFEKAHGLPHDYLNVAITARGSGGAFQRLEVLLEISNKYAVPTPLRSIPTWPMLSRFTYMPLVSHCASACPDLPTTLLVDGKELWKQMMLEASAYNLPVIKLIRRLRESGKYRVAALTNNFQIPAGTTAEDEEALGSAPTDVRNLFDEFIESSHVGLRKPDPRFFEHALKLLRVDSPAQVVFLDDLGINLKTAERMGMKTIKVGIYDVIPALEKLQTYLPDVDLSDIINSAKL